MANFIIADNQELTRFAVERLIRQDESNTIKRASDRARLVEMLKEQENSVVVLDYTLFDFTGEDQLLSAMVGVQYEGMLHVSSKTYAFVGTCH